MRKNTKKTEYVPAYTVDLTEVETLMDVMLAFVDAKIKAKVPVTYNDVDTIIESTIANHKSFLFDGNNCVVLHTDGSIERLTAEPVKERPGYFKRVWNAIRGK